MVSNAAVTLIEDELADEYNTVHETLLAAEAAGFALVKKAKIDALIATLGKFDSVTVNRDELEGLLVLED